MSRRVYVGNLPRDIREGELDHEFRRYGRVERIDVKNGFAFVEFDHERDADRAVRDLDDRTVFGRRIRVEPAHSDRSRRRQELRHGRHRVIVRGLPHGFSWQDLKDMFKKAGDAVFADISRDGDGIVEFDDDRDVDEAIHQFHRKVVEGSEIEVFEVHAPIPYILVRNFSNVFSHEHCALRLNL
eukprot:TRINITY_DN611_c0_g1_i1.p1 TRINITY_DN611_c0_g1~~TRINITY_DN611_c0_g1_i1.p1  ORF type:complete len:184 (-),score=45.35 TRINITY_DN611_c0_g1_i1:11-562(-)